MVDGVGPNVRQVCCQRAERPEKCVTVNKTSAANAVGQRGIEIAIESACSICRDTDRTRINVQRAAVEGDGIVRVCKRTLRNAVAADPRNHSCGGVECAQQSVGPKEANRIVGKDWIGIAVKPNGCISIDGKRSRGDRQNTRCARKKVIAELVRR